MANIWDEIRNALHQSRATLLAADDAATQMASLLRGRLTHVSPYILRDLKRELQNFDAHKKEWKK